MPFSVLDFIDPDDIHLTELDTPLVWTERGVLVDKSIEAAAKTNYHKPRHTQIAFHSGSSDATSQLPTIGIYGELQGAAKARRSYCWVARTAP